MHMDTSESTISIEKSEKKVTIEEKIPNIPEKNPATLPDIGG